MRLLDIPRNGMLAIGNLVRFLRRKGLDCVVLPIQGSYPERAPRRDPLPFPLSLLSLFPSEVSLEEMQAIAETIAGDRRVQGVILRFETLPAGPPTLYSLRRILLELRARGKRLVAWLPAADTWAYYLASACDEIILPPSGHLFALGLQAEAVFLKDTLGLVGAQADLEAIAEYKVTPDTFRRSTMTDAHREMLNAIVDSYFDELVSAIAQGRGLDPARVRELIDAMPLTPAEAVEAGLADAVLYEDQLAAHLASIAPWSRTPRTKHPGGGGSERGSAARHHDRGNNDAPASRQVTDTLSPGARSQGQSIQRPRAEEEIGLLTWREASRWVRRPIKWTTRQRIGVVALKGLIVPGRSRRIPVPIPVPFVEAQAGAETIAEALRRAEADDHIAAVIFHVETPGGSSLASDLICREIRRLRQQKPVVVLMGEQATSGGYYVSALADRIVARPTTLTGSIGIWGGKLVLRDLYDSLEVGREAVQRGTMAGLYSELAPFSEEERSRVRRELGEAYARFKARVAQGRAMTEEQVEEIARGRVWTGAQALEIGLVDELGDFETALAAAKEVAGLKREQEYTVVQIPPPRHGLLPQSFPSSHPRSPAAHLGAFLGALRTHGWLGLCGRERAWALAPWLLRVRG